jgi:hypothetical protein
MVIELGNMEFIGDLDKTSISGEMWAESPKIG